MRRQLEVWAMFKDERGNFAYPHAQRDTRGVWTNSHFELMGGGGMLGVGVGGGTAGVGCRTFIYDDPFGSRQQAESPAYIKRAWDFFINDGYTRVEKGGGIWINQTRWVPNDPYGKAQAELEHEGWDVINYPALATHDEPHRRIGEALAPFIKTQEQLERMRKTFGSYVFNSLYQGNPAVAEGRVFDPAWFRHRYNLPPKQMAKTLSFVFGQVDTNYKENPRW